MKQIDEAVEFPLPRTRDAVFLYTNQKGETAFIQVIKGGGLSIEADDFSIDMKSTREAESFLKKHKWKFSGVE